MHLCIGAYNYESDSCQLNLRCLSINCFVVSGHAFVAKSVVLGSIRYDIFKGQLISKGIFNYFNSSKYEQKNMTLNGKMTKLLFYLKNVPGILVHLSKN